MGNMLPLSSGVESLHPVLSVRLLVRHSICRIVYLSWISPTIIGLSGLSVGWSVHQLSACLLGGQFFGPRSVSVFVMLKFLFFGTFTTSLDFFNVPHTVLY